MKQNKYDESEFFAAYSQLPRSINGLTAGLKWTAFRALLPDLRDKRLLDLGCGFGWHCRYAPVDNYQQECRRQTNWLTENVIKYHRTIATYVNTLIDSGFLIKRVEEPKPRPDTTDPDTQDQSRRPPFLVIAAVKE